MKTLEATIQQHHAATLPIIISSGSSSDTTSFEEPVMSEPTRGQAGTRDAATPPTLPLAGRTTRKPSRGALEAQLQVHHAEVSIDKQNYDSLGLSSTRFAPQPPLEKCT
jgi:hypothetical protein